MGVTRVGGGRWGDGDGGVMACDWWGCTGAARHGGRVWRNVHRGEQAGGTSERGKEVEGGA